MISKTPTHLVQQISDTQILSIDEADMREDRVLQMSDRASRAKNASVNNNIMIGQHLSIVQEESKDDG